MKKVLVYDGECQLCNRFVNFAVKMNKNKDLYVTDFNSQWIKDLTFEVNSNHVSYISKHKVYEKSDAVLHFLVDANDYFKPLLVTKLIPRKLRNSLYDYVAKNRHKYNKNCTVKSVKFYQMYLK
ncbi:thiol-disulfide oxidoreductase DCC family protein [Nosocomiicoccus massiliensis]|uniref:thiol-disulfide oxidoreductase DCC family protein n=1 Tax=Nosocomiicoccus massiliensis TaxID=1232430 RepID=UPI000594E3AE|nr:DUF393 domain-containing protein [Nosocomiicoccus massiliensis]